MAIICDTCSADVTPDKDSMEDDEVSDYEILDINGKLCLCRDCYCALADFLRSKNFKEVVAKYKKQSEEEE